MTSGAKPLVSPTRQRLLERLRAAFWLALLLPALAFAFVAAWLYRQEFADARLQLDHAARIAQEHALKLFDTNEMVLQRMLDLLGNSTDDEVLAKGAEVHERLKRMAEGLPQVQGLYVNSADARALGMSMLYPPPRNYEVSDREWYQSHRAGGPPLFITEQLISRAMKEPFFDMSRRRTFADGTFAGTVHVSLRPEYLTRFYENLAKTEPNVRFAVMRSDGKLIARWPGEAPPGGAVPADHALMRAIAGGQSAGSLDRAISAFDGVERLIEFRHLNPYPVFVVTSITRSAVIAGWQRKLALLALAMVPLTLGLAWMARVALRRTHEELQALQRLDDETALRQRIELTLLQSQKLEALGRLTGGVAHDFNNLLMVVTSNLFLLRRLAPQLADGPQLAAIERAVAAGTKLTRQLLAFAGRQALRPEVMRLQDRLPALLELLPPLLGPSIELGGSVQADTAPIEVDPAELELALINLAVNAKDAMRDGGRLDVTARNASRSEAPDGADFVVIEVADTGTGVDPALIKRVFDAFFTTKSIGFGTGLGLSQVQALCATAGGFARIENRPEGGARVQLFFKPAPHGASIAAESADAVQPMPELRCRVLLVEDNEAVAHATGELLRSLGCTVEHAADARSALAALERSPGAADVVLSDIEMPGDFDGIALAAQLQARWPQLPVVLMTGYAARLEQAVRLRLDVLPKPCAPAVIAAALGKAIATRKGVEPVAAAD